MQLHSICSIGPVLVVTGGVTILDVVIVVGVAVVSAFVFLALTYSP